MKIIILVLIPGYGITEKVGNLLSAKKIPQ